MKQIIKENYTLTRSLKSTREQQEVTGERKGTLDFPFYGDFKET